MGRRSARTLLLPRRERLRRAAEIQALFEQGRREERASFTALWRERGAGRKVGFAVSRRIGRAVDRNRARRRLREAYRRQQQALPSGIEVIFVGRPAVLSRPFTALLGDMHQTMQVLARNVTGGARRGTGMVSRP